MRGHLVIADISGYTRFLTESELEHANGIITDLLNVVIAAIHAPLKVSNVEGDAVFMYGETPEGMSGQTVLESVESVYCSFAAALETMVLNTTCTCNACANIGSLGLKIVMHCGEFVRSEIGGRESLTGPDVILAHRLLKNHIREQTGISDYMLVTKACVDDLGVDGIVSTWIAHEEAYDDLGEIRGYVSSLPDVWAFVRSQNEDKVTQKDAWVTMTRYSTAPPAVVWDHLIDPLKRTAWLFVTDNETTMDSRGRIGAGSEYHCVHGENDEVQVFTILDMKTVDYITLVTEIMENVGLRYTEYVIPSGTGTRLVTMAAPAFDPRTGEDLPAEVLEEMRQPVGDKYAPSLDRLVEMSNRAAANFASV